MKYFWLDIFGGMNARKGYLMLYSVAVRTVLLSVSQSSTCIQLKTSTEI